MKVTATEEVEAALANAELGPEWAATMTFYRALHLIEAHFAAAGIHHSSHRQRSVSVGRLLPAVLPAYLQLERASRRARYDAPGLVTWHDYRDAQSDFAAIEAALRPLLES